MANSTKDISRFHYLTQDLPGISHQDLAEIACKNGIRWIQLRVKNKPEEEWLRIAHEVKVICDQFKTTLIINDHAEIANAVDADGVHLGKNDRAIGEARNILGNEKIIGGTANTLEDILQLQSEGADYIGLGPFRFTATKHNISAILELDGYHQIFKASNFQINIPIIAIGGITIADVKPLMLTGVYGVAVSSAINSANDKEKVIKNFLSLF